MLQKDKLGTLTVISKYYSLSLSLSIYIYIYNYFFKLWEKKGEGWGPAYHMARHLPPNRTTIRLLDCGDIAICWSESQRLDSFSFFS